MGGILLVSGISLVCVGIFFNEFVYPSLKPSQKPQESLQDTQKEKTGTRVTLN